MKHTIKQEDTEINWSISISPSGCLCIKAGGLTAVLIDPEGKVTICRSGTKLGLTFRGQVR